MRGRETGIEDRNDRSRCDDPDEIYSLRQLHPWTCQWREQDHDLLFASHERVTRGEDTTRDFVPDVFRERNTRIQGFVATAARHHGHACDLARARLHRLEGDIDVLQLFPAVRWAA